VIEKLELKREHWVVGFRQRKCGSDKIEPTGDRKSAINNESDLNIYMDRLGCLVGFPWIRT
jgi:hypothetical protein